MGVKVFRQLLLCSFKIHNSFRPISLAMYTENFQSIFIFTVCIILLLMLFGAFIMTVVYRYKRNQRVYLEDLEVLRSGHQNDLLKGQLEIQEYTFSNISREIHDNVGQKLSLAMLLINTQTFEDVD